MPPISLLAPEYIHSLPAPQLTPDTTIMAPQHLLHPLGDPQCPLCYLYPFWPLSTYTPCQPPNTPHDAPWCPSNGPCTPRSPQCPLMPPIPLLVVNCHHFATDHLPADKMLIFHHCHFQLSSLCN